MVALASGGPGCGELSADTRQGRAQHAGSRFRDYPAAREAIGRARKRLFDRYRSATSAAARARVLKQAATTVLSAIDRDLFPFWYGTPWDFNGVSVTPGQGKIACGYFVTTVLRHAGFNVARAILAQQPSMYIIRTLTGAPHIWNSYRLPIGKFVAGMKARGEGLYIVGLDCHVGFLVVRNGRAWFVHASYGTPAKVVREDALTSPILSSSRYRMVGNLTANPKTMAGWLWGTRFVTRRWKKRSK